jgi:hypothetical protein
MPKEYVRKSLERDVYLSRKDNKQTSRESLQKSVERLAKLMTLSEKDKAELMVYADELLEHRDDKEESPVRKRVVQSGASQ